MCPLAALRVGRRSHELSGFSLGTLQLTNMFIRRSARAPEKKIVLARYLFSSPIGTFTKLNCIFTKLNDAGELLC